MVGQQDLCEPEHERTDEGDLERPEDILTPAPEEDVAAGDECGDPRIDARPAHDGAQQESRDQVQDDRHQLIRQVAAQTDNEVHRPVHGERKRNQVAAVLREKIVKVEATFSEELPVIAEEPDIARRNEVEDEARELDGGEHRRRGAILGRSARRMSDDSFSFVDELRNHAGR